MNVQHRRHGQFPGSGNFTPRYEPVRRVIVQPAALVRLDYRLRIVSIELIEIVQIAKGFCMDIRGVQGALTRLITPSDLKFSIKIAPCVVQGKDARWSERDRC